MAFWCGLWRGTFKKSFVLFAVLVRCAGFGAEKLLSPAPWERAALSWRGVSQGKVLRPQSTGFLARCVNGLSRGGLAGAGHHNGECLAGWKDDCMTRDVFSLSVSLSCSVALSLPCSLSPFVKKVRDNVLWDGHCHRISPYSDARAWSVMEIQISVFSVIIIERERPGIGR